MASEEWKTKRAIADIWRAGRAQVSGDCGGGVEVKLTPSQELLRIHLKELGIETLPEYGFWRGKRWRFDLACFERRLAFEISGGNWTGGHRRGKAQESEYDKLNTAQMAGWRVLQWTNRQVLTGEAKAWLAQWLAKPRR